MHDVIARIAVDTLLASWISADRHDARAEG